METQNNVPIGTSCECSNEVRITDVVFTSLMFFSLTHLRTKSTKISTNHLGLAKHVNPNELIWVFQSQIDLHICSGKSSFFAIINTPIKIFSQTKALRLNWKWNKQELIKWGCILCPTIKYNNHYCIYMLNIHYLMYIKILQMLMYKMSRLSDTKNCYYKCYKQHCKVTSMN